MSNNKWIVFLLFFLIVGFSGRSPKPDPLPIVPAPVVVPVTPSPSSVSDYEKHIYPVKGWDAEYDQVISILQAKTPIDSPCSDVKVFLKGIVSAESGFDRTNVYNEPAPLNQKSIGLFQLSLTDNSYGCGFLNEADIKNPIKNIECFYKIMASLKKSHPSENIFEYGGRYFSTLRWNRYPKWAGKRQSGVNEVLSYVRKNGCAL